MILGVEITLSNILWYGFMIIVSLLSIGSFISNIKSSSSFKNHLKSDLNFKLNS